MLVNSATAGHLVEVALDALQANSDRAAEVLEGIPAPIYVTDRDGTLSHFNQACVEFAGRTPRTGSDKWCVTWRLLTTAGDPLPHDQCPMAVAIREARPVRGAEAIAERPDGTRVHFMPFPTPLFDANGELAGAVNLLLDVSEQRTPKYLSSQAERCRRLAMGVDDVRTAQSLLQMAATYDVQALKLTRLNRADT